MRQDWIEDILAVLDTGSFARAAEARFRSQSAFTRRIHAIEEALGGPLFDRDRKPVALLPHVEAEEQRLRRLLHDMRDLSARLAGPSAAHPAVRMACQHALATTHAPTLLAAFARRNAGAVHLRSGNRDECLRSLLAGDVDLAVIYDTSGLVPVGRDAGVRRRVIGADRLVPVASTPETGSDIPYIGYPPASYLFEIVESGLRPRLPARVHLVPKAETALTLAMHQFVRAGLGLAWLPEALVADDLATGRLWCHPDLPTQSMSIVALNLDRDDGASPLFEEVLADVTVV